MIAIESFRKYDLKDIVTIITFAGSWLVFSLLINQFVEFQNTYVISLLFLTMVMSLIVHFVRKAGTSTLFYFFSALFTYNINNFGIIGSDKLIVFLLAGVLFEILFLIFRLEIRNIQIDIVLGTAFSSMSIPLIIGLLLSFDVIFWLSCNHEPSYRIALVIYLLESGEWNVNIATRTHVGIAILCHPNYGEIDTVHLDVLPYSYFIFFK